MIVSILSVLGLVASTVAQTTPTVVCIAGQCVQGFTNTTIGAKLSASGASTQLHLLPGQYTSTTDPQLLHDLLVSSSASLSSSAGFPSSPSLPLDLVLQPGIAIYSEARYSGQDAFSNLPTSPVGNVTLPIAARSLALSENVWVAVSSNTAEGRTILWESVPDVTQISLTPSLSLLDVQSTTCSPACAGAGVCSAAGQCVCPSNFAGSSCESCAAGFFGSQCQACPEGCDKCDEGISGSGRCLSSKVDDTDPRKCNCVNGVCNPDGSCACNDGWVDKSDGTKCSGCAPGFFLTSAGDCGVCQPGCVQCSDTTSTCNACRSGFILNINDRTKCDPVKPTTSSGTPCPDNTFSAGAECQVCSSVCSSCTGPGDGDCLTCSPGFYLSGGQCVPADSNGVCEGSGGLVADNVKRTCEACPAKCTTCGIPGFTPALTIDRLTCTQCLPGFVLSGGKCVESCPAGSFVDPQDNFTCIACSSSCGTCAGSADFCLTCPGNLLASDGKCVSTCPSDSFISTSNTTPPTRSCTKCHPDCASCDGSSFNQCTACGASRPVLSTITGATSGRCLPTCSKNQFFDGTSRTCQTCDGSCASCSGAGPSKCLSCTSNTKVVRGGQCVDANCASNAGVIAGLGVCLSELVQIPTTTNGEAPLPTISGLSNPTVVKGKLQWWQILLMVLGCVFIFVAFLWCCRRRARKQRAKKTAVFAQGKGINKQSWKWGMLAAGWRKLFKRKPKAGQQQQSELPIAYNHHEVTSRGRPVSFSRGEDIKMSNLPKGNSSRHERRQTRDELESYIDAYGDSRRSLSIRSHTPSTLPDLDGYYSSKKNKYSDRDRLRRQATGASRRERDLDRDSMFSEMTGNKRSTPEPRQPVKRNPVPIYRDDSSSSSSRSASPVRDAGKLRKSPPLQKVTSDETLSSVVIQPQQKDAILVDFVSEISKSPSPPVQYQAAPFFSSMPVQTPAATGLTPAQAYAYTMAPDLLGGAPNPAILNPNAPTAFGMGMTHTGTNLHAINPVPITLTGTNQLGGGAIGATDGLYWVQKAPGTNDLVLRPAHTGSSTMTTQTAVSSSKNPFRV